MIGLFAFLAPVFSEAIKITTVNDSQKSGQRQGCMCWMDQHAPKRAYLSSKKKVSVGWVFYVYPDF
jgi:hypothetical protein